MPALLAGCRSAQRRREGAAEWQEQRLLALSLQSLQQCRHWSRGPTAAGGSIVKDLQRSAQCGDRDTGAVGLPAGFRSTSWGDSGCKSLPPHWTPGWGGPRPRLPLRHFHPWMATTLGPGLVCRTSLLFVLYWGELKPRGCQFSALLYTVLTPPEAGQSTGMWGTKAQV